jgi:hypothetical protein
MRIKGALHLHSTLSRDGTLTIAELAEWYLHKGYQFIALTEHAEDLDDLKTQTLRQDSAKNSSPRFCVIPGIEFSCAGGMHIPGIGVSDLVAEEDPLRIIDEIHKQDGFAILAHPKRIGWECSSEVLLAVDAVEIWNIDYDGKYLPAARALRGYRRMQAINPKLLAVASHDFHRKDSFHDLAIEMDVSELSRDTILRNLRQGCYAMKSRFFRADPHARTAWAMVASVQLMTPLLEALRNARALLIRWSS